MGTRRFGIEVAAPFRLDLTAWALRRRPHNAVDGFDGTTYRRTLMVGRRPLEVAVCQEAGRDQAELVVSVRGRGAVGDEVEEPVRLLLEWVLGLGVDIGPFYVLADTDPRLAEVAHRFRGMRPPRFPTVFEALVNAIACQQLSLEVGIHLLNRLAVRYGARASDRAGAPYGFPTPQSLAGADLDELRSMGFSRSKGRALTLLADQVTAGEVDLETMASADDDQVRASLLALTGVGRWSTEYAMLRGMGRLHVLPGDDVGARNNLRRRFALTADAGYDEMAALSQVWSPYGGLVYLHLLLDGLWNAGHLTQVAAPTAG